MRTSVAKAATGLGVITLVSLALMGSPELALAAPADADGTDPGVAPSGLEAAEASPGDTAPAASGTAPPPPVVDFDRLLRLPTSYKDSARQHGGSTAGDWRRRFAEADEAVEKAKRNLQATQSELQHTAADSGQWQMGAPGLGKPDAEHSTVSFKLRTLMREQRSELEAAKKQQRDLRIEADLRAVPGAWRRPEGQPDPDETRDPGADGLPLEGGG